MPPNAAVLGVPPMALIQPEKGPCGRMGTGTNGACPLAISGIDSFPPPLLY